ncbi:energy transducer TonB [Carboxylicivirga marina]|uniref:TonB C-terminal domain-containing protein n=1 Tax=Carboxylicivirga marina TaxID=2800988 RepID=A0ABS1HEN7_9BACT|nr:hypothetical protein [Carboxylicivirga marina]MBK3515773.1 hypothetical protein [Carboxylicivirga marina]
MKKMLLTIGMCFLVLGIFAQGPKKVPIFKGDKTYTGYQVGDKAFVEIDGKAYLVENDKTGKTVFHLADSRVTSPVFTGVKVESVETVKKNPICCYLEENLDVKNLVNDFDYPIEGTVGVEFTISTDGSVSDFEEVNHVTKELYQAVVDCIKETDGMWAPGTVEFKEDTPEPTPMETRIYVKFDTPDNASFEELARQHYRFAIKRYARAENIQDDKLLSKNKKTRKSTRMFNRSLNHLEAATVYIPNDPSLAFWKAKNFEQLGMHKEMFDMLEQRKMLLSLSSEEQTLKQHYDLAIISY